MKCHLIFLYVLYSGIFGCKAKEHGVESPIHEKKMIAIMTEIYYLDAHFSGLNAFMKDSIVNLKITDLLMKYEIHKDQFKQAQTYYNENENARKKLEKGVKLEVERTVE